MSSNDKITLTIEISMNDLWDAVWGSDGAGMTYWSSQVRKPDGSDIDLWVMPDYEPNPQDFKVYDDEEEKWHLVTLEQLAKGYQLALTSGQKHCGGYPLDLEDHDACFGDMVIQYAIFGELTYG
jgi:hypothetical protein